MKKRFVFMSILLMIVIGLMGCKKKVDEQELENAENMTNGYTTMMINADAFSTFSGSAPWLLLLQQDGAWSEEQAVFDVPDPDWPESLYYYCKIPISPVEDTFLFLVRLTPDVHPDSTEGVFVTLVDGWLWWIVQDDIWWHLLVNRDESDPSYVYGTLTWYYNEDDHLWIFTYTKSMEDESLEATCETNFGVAGQLILAPDGSGSPDDNFGTYEDERFVEFTFFALPDEEGNDGYYTLASEDWEEEHYFKIEFNLKHEY